MKRALVFPGYGSQIVGMGKELYDTHRVVQELFEEASQCLDINFVKLCFASSDTELSKTAQAYPALFLIGASITAVLRESGIAIDVVTGYDQGEYAACYMGDVFTLPDGLYLLHKLGLLNQDYADQETLRALRVTDLDVLALQEACYEVNLGNNGLVSVVAYNTETDSVVLGNGTAVNQLRVLLDAYPTIGVQDAPIGGGAHSLVVSSVASSLRMYTEKVDFHLSRIPLITGLRGAVMTEPDQVKEHLIAQVTNPVRWDMVMQGLVKYDEILIAGPAHQLYDIVRSRFPSKSVHLITRDADVRALETVIHK